MKQYFSESESLTISILFVEHCLLNQFLRASGNHKRVTNLTSLGSLRESLKLIIIFPNKLLSVGLSVDGFYWDKLTELRINIVT